MMYVKSAIILVLAHIAVIMASPAPSFLAYQQGQENIAEADESLAQYVPLEDDVVQYEPLYLVRTRRDIEFNPHVNKQDGTTNAGATITHKGANHEVTGHWNKNVGGQRAKPNYGVRGTFKW